jgi:hypothetical protein
MPAKLNIFKTPASGQSRAYSADYSHPFAGQEFLLLIQRESSFKILVYNSVQIFLEHYVHA